MVVISATVNVQLLQYVPASAMEKDLIVTYVVYRQETGIDSGKVTFSNKRFVLTPCLPLCNSL